MMNIRRITSALAAVVLGGGLVAVTGQAAYADTIPVDGGIYELYIPYFNPGAAKCLDVPNGDPTPGRALVVYHCHASDGHGDNQLWKATRIGARTFLQNQATGLCLSPDPGLSTKVVQEPCALDLGISWLFQPNRNLNNTTAGVYSFLAGQCLATQDSSGADGTPVVLAPCTVENLNDPAHLWVRQNWVLA